MKDDEKGLAPIVIKGYKFFNSYTGQNILIKGIDYYPRPNSGDLDVNNIDFFTEQYRYIWERDIEQFKELGVNAVRLYSVDPQNDHSAFMCALNNAGIYALVELASGNCSTCAILSYEAPDCYPAHLKIRGQEIMREFSRYSNTLAFSAGNEVNHFVPLGKGPEWNAPCLKKFVKDMRAYKKKCDGMRHVPVGLIMADSDREDNALYYNCQMGDDDLDHAEWYGLNTYVYCDANHTNFEDSTGFKTLSESFESYNYSIPVLLTEFGCLSKSFPTVEGYQGQRSFDQAKWLGLPSVENDFAGGFAFEYSIESANARTPFPFKEFGEQNYGIGYLSPENCDDVHIRCEYVKTPSFYNLKTKFAAAKSGNLTMDEFTPGKWRSGRTQCPPKFPRLESFHWAADKKIDARCPNMNEVDFVCPAPNVSEQSSSNSEPSIFANLIVIFPFIAIVYYSAKVISSLSTTKAKSFVPVSDHTRSIDQDESSEEVPMMEKGNGYSTFQRQD